MAGGTIRDRQSVRRPPVGLMVEVPVRDLEQTAAVHVHDVDVRFPVRVRSSGRTRSATRRATTPGSKHPNEFGPTGASTRRGDRQLVAELPSAFTTQISLWSSEALVSNRIWLPSGDHAPRGLVDCEVRRRDPLQPGSVEVGHEDPDRHHHRSIGRTRVARRRASSRRDVFPGIRRDPCSPPPSETRIV